MLSRVGINLLIISLTSIRTRIQLEVVDDHHGNQEDGHQVGGGQGGGEGRRDQVLEERMINIYNSWKCPYLSQ